MEVPLELNSSKHLYIIHYHCFIRAVLAGARCHTLQFPATGVLMGPETGIGFMHNSVLNSAAAQRSAAGDAGRWGKGCVGEAKRR